MSSDEVARLESGRPDGDGDGDGEGFMGFGEPRQAFVFSATLTLPDEDRKLVP